jgi:hypothetical protein
MSFAIILIAAWMLFVGAVWADWISTSPHTLGVLTIIVALVVLIIEVFLPLRGIRNRRD